MSLSAAVTLPVSVLNPALATGQQLISLDQAALTADIGELAAEILKVGLSLELPNPANIGLQLGALEADIALAVSAPALAVTPPGVTLDLVGAADIQGDIVSLLPSIAMAAKLKAGIAGALDLPGLHWWSYSGPAAAFGSGLETFTRGGWPSVKVDDSINALIIATESFSSWGPFSASIAVPQGPGGLHYAGLLKPIRVFKFAKQLVNYLDSFILRFEGKQFALQAQLDIALGVTLPDVGVALTASIAAAASIPAIIANLGLTIDASVKFVPAINAKLALLLKLSLDFGAILLSGGGLSVWKYSGPAANLGVEFAAAMTSGLPNGSGPNTPAYGMVLATNNPASWAGLTPLIGVTA